MGSGASTPIAAQGELGSPMKRKDPTKAMVAFTSLEAEMGKPLDATDVCTPRGTAQADLARQEVQRLRRLIKSGSKRVEHATADQENSQGDRQVHYQAALFQVAPGGAEERSGRIEHDEAGHYQADSAQQSLVA